MSPLNKDYSNFTKEELIREINRLKNSLKKQKYGLVWLDVPEAFEADSENKLPILKEQAELSIKNKDDKPTHILIEGENYHALTCLNYTHKEKIDVIYIDPPYNTGSDGFKYKDKRFLDKYPDGTDVPKNHPLRHSYWLSFMSKRLHLAKNLLKDDGLIFISINEEELFNLKLLCDSIFLENNFITNICVKMSHLSGVKMSHIDKKLPKIKEYLLIYAKNKNNVNINPVFEKVKADESFSRYKSFLIKNKEQPTDINKWRVITLKQAMKESNIDVNDLNTLDKFYIENADKIFRTARNRSEQFLGLPKDNQFRFVITASGLRKLAYKREEVIFISTKLKGNEKEVSLVQPLGDIWLDIGINNLHNEGGIGFRNGKKPLKLIKRILSMHKNKSAIILDFFAGSGTTTHAVMGLNNEDNGLRQCILVTNNEDNICTDVCLKRLRNVINGYNNIRGLGNSLQYYKTAFVCKNNIKYTSDEDRVELAQNAGELLAIAENTLYLKEKNDYWQIFEDKGRYTAIYFREELSNFEQFIKKVSEFKGNITVYVFSWGNDEFSEDFNHLKGVGVKSIPQPILEIYKQIYTLS